MNTNVKIKAVSIRSRCEKLYKNNYSPQAQWTLANIHRLDFVLVNVHECLNFTLGKQLLNIERARPEKEKFGNWFSNLSDRLHDKIASNFWWKLGDHNNLSKAMSDLWSNVYAKQFGQKPQNSP